jgi:hypothetical protein
MNFLLSFHYFFTLRLRSPRQATVRTCCSAPLRTLNEPFIRDLRVFVSNDLGERFQVKFQRWDRSGREAEMFVMAAMTLLSTAGIAFYIRFLVALCKECKPRRIGYWLRMRLGSGENAIAELQERERTIYAGGVRTV